MKEIYNTQERIKEYFERDDEVSQSLLKQGLKDFKNYYTPVEYKETESMVIGSLVDIILTNEYPDEVLDENFVFIDEYLSIAKDSHKMVLRQLYDQQTDKEKTLLEISDEEILNVCDETGFQTNWKAATRVNKIREFGNGYYNMLKDSYKEDGTKKTETTSEEWHVATEVAEEMRIILNEFVEELEKEEREVIILYQQENYFKMLGIDCKALYDVIVLALDRKNETLQIYVFDYKTVFGTDILKNFESSYYSFRYDIQGAFYSEGLMYNKQLLKHFCSLFDSEIDNVKVAGFSFIVGNIGEPHLAVRVDMTKEAVEQAIYGRKEKIVNDFVMREIKGVKQLVEEYKYYIKNQDGKEKRIHDFEKGKRLTIDEYRRIK